MICPKCGYQNSPDAKFCVGCGLPLTNNQTNPINNQGFYQQPISNNVGVNTSIEPIESLNQMNVGPIESFQNQPLNTGIINEVQTPINPTLVQAQTPINNMNSNLGVNNHSSKKISFANFFFIILAVILKPFTSFKEELDKFSDIKNSAIVTGIVAIGATLLTLIKNMLSAVRVTNILSDETEWIWENLSEVKYFEIIIKYLLVYLGLIVVTAGVYYIASLIIKKQTNFSKLLGISAISLCPLFLCYLVFAPILSLLNVRLGTIAMKIGKIYSMIIIYETVNREIPLEGNKKIYFNFACFTVLSTLGYFLNIKLVELNAKDAVSKVTSQTKNILDMLR